MGIELTSRRKRKMRRRVLETSVSVGRKERRHSLKEPELKGVGG